MKVGIIGAGTMGQGIAKAFAQVDGYEVALCDIKQEWAEGGKAKIAKGYDRLVQKGKLTQEAVDAILAKITPGLKEDLCADCDLIVEAAFEDMGVKIAHVTLHVGLGTFRPVKVENVLDHHMHSEFYVVEEAEAKKVNDTKAAGGRVICVGTTSCRTVESASTEDGILQAKTGWTDIFIYPGYKFKILDALITNFHLPESTLVMLVSALAGRENILAAYNEAIREKYRFFSFGDAMFIADDPQPVKKAQEVKWKNV